MDQKDYEVRICFEEKNDAGHYKCGSHLQSHTCPDEADGICHVWFQGITSVPLIKFNLAYATMCAECLVKALTCEEYQVEQVTFLI